MRLAILGTRGVPANYGGFETFAEQLGSRLALRGHEVTVYGRRGYVPRDVRRYMGMRVVRLPAPRSKYLETVVHGLLSAVDAARHPFDLVYVCNSANVPAVILLRLCRRRVVLNVDGLEWRRAKWNRLGRTYYRCCAWLAAQLDAEIVTDARVIQDHYLRAYGRSTTFFPYGTSLEQEPDHGFLADLGLAPRAYLLYVSRLEPENNAHVVIEAYGQVRSDMPLVIVGDAPYASDYIARLRATRDGRVKFVGAIYGAGYRALQAHAAIYVQATEVGGTHPALVEAMGSGNAIAANDVPEHREVLGEAGRYYQTPAELSRLLQELIDDPAATEALRYRARERARAVYSWDAITDAYERWLRGLVPGGAA